MNLSTLRARVTTWYVGLLAAALIVFGASLYMGVRSFLTASLQHSLSDEAKLIANTFLSSEEQKGVTWMAEEISEADAPDHSGRFIRITRQDGSVLYESGDTRDPHIDIDRISHPPFAETTESFRQETQAGAPFLIYTLPFTSSSGKKYLIEMGATLGPIERMLSSLLKILVLITPLILAGAALGGHFLMTRPLRPLVVLAEQAERVGGHQLGERLPVITTGDEMERLSLSLNRMINRLEEALNHNRRFSADVSHELRTPLTILRGELEQVVQTPGLSIGVIEAIGSSLEEIERMARIVENLLTIARLDTGADIMDRQCVDLNLIAQWTVDQMRLLAEEKQITMRNTETCSTLILADSARVKQVLVNLLDNAIKYTPEGGEIRVSVTNAPRTAVLEVSDSGIGIPPESLPNVFERFYRSDKARSRESGGTGLGLSIVQAICNAHGGSVAIQSSEGRGTTVRVELPLSASQIAQLTEVPSISRSSLREIGPPNDNEISKTQRQHTSIER